MLHPMITVALVATLGLALPAAAAGPASKVEASQAAALLGGETDPALFQQHFRRAMAGTDDTLVTRTAMSLLSHRAQQMVEDARSSGAPLVVERLKDGSRTVTVGPSVKSNRRSARLGAVITRAGLADLRDGNMSLVARMAEAAREGWLRGGLPKAKDAMKQEAVRFGKAR